MQESLDSDTLKDDIQEMVQQQGFSNDEVVTALARRCFQTSTRNLKRRLASWNIRRGRLAGDVSDALAEAINYLFHHTLLNDAEIAARIINDYGLQTSHRQVRSIRSLFGWTRAARGPARATQQTSTSLHVQQAFRWRLRHLKRPSRQRGKLSTLITSTTLPGVAIGPSRPIIWRQITRHSDLVYLGRVPIAFRTLC